MKFEEIIDLHKDKSINIEIKREMQTISGDLEIAWQKKSLPVSKLTVSSVRKLLGQVKIEAIKTDKEGASLLQILLSAAPVKAILTKEEMTWAIQHGLIVRFNNDPKQLQKEVQQKGLSGHKTALYDESFLKKKMEEEEVPEIAFQEILTQAALSAMTHIQNKDTDAAFVLSESHPEKQEKTLITSSNKPSWLGDTTLLEPENEQLVIQHVNTQSYEGFHDAVVQMVDNMILYIKKGAGSDTSKIPSIGEQHIEALDKEWLDSKQKKQEKDLDDEKESQIDRTIVETKGIFVLLKNGYWYMKQDLETLKEPYTYNEEEGLFYTKGDDLGYDENGEIDLC